MNKVRYLFIPHVQISSLMRNYFAGGSKDVKGTMASKNIFKLVHRLWYAPHKLTEITTVKNKLKYNNYCK